MSVEKRQQRVQIKILKLLEKSPWGKSYRINSKDIETWKYLPISKYSDFNKLYQEKSDLPFSTEKVLHWTPTTGTTGIAKWIPLTSTLRKSFNQMFLLWAKDILKHYPSIVFGKCFASIAPSNKDDDLDYIQSWTARILSLFIISNHEVKKSKNVDEFHSRLAQTILQKDLRVISIWSPSYLLNFLSFLKENHNIVEDDFKNLWPNLKIISCWGDGASAPGFQRLRQMFPKTFIQAKGLLATEGPMTIPLVGLEGGVPLLDLVYFEFIDSNGHLKKLHELKINAVYEILPSWQGGFPRYRINDLVKVIGFEKTIPLLRFESRKGVTSDIVGEKITEEFAQLIITQLFSDSIINDADSFLIPIQSETDDKIRYSIVTSAFHINAQVNILEAMLLENPHYALARKQGQISFPEVIHVENPQAILLEASVKAGFGRGDVKPCFLVTNHQIIQQLMSDFEKETSGLKPFHQAKAQLINPELKP